MKKTEGPLYEYACHEGNYDVCHLLEIYRNLEVQEAAEARSKWVQLHNDSSYVGPAENRAEEPGEGKMTDRTIGTLPAVIAVTVMLLVPAVAVAQSTDTPEPTRTPWGAPDLQGVWDFRSITPMERPDDLADKEFLTEEEAANLEQETIERNEGLLNRPARRTEVSDSVDTGEDGAPGFYNNFWLDRGTTTVGTRRTSLIVDPPNGKMPAWTLAAEEKQAAASERRSGVSSHEPTPGGYLEDLGANGLQLRCITGFNSGPPMTPGGYNNNVQLFQTPDHVALLNEMNHNTRIIPLDGRPHVDLGQWTGDSRGHWDGDTLVVETTSFLRETSFVAGRTDAQLRLTERFTRVSPEMLMYEATIDDPSVWSQPWTYEVPMQLNEQLIYEYACHEGNYGLYNILAGARAEEAAAQGSR